MTLGTRVGRRSLVGGSSEAPVEHLILSLMSLAKDEKKKALKLFPVNDVDDEVDGRVQGDEQVGNLCQSRYSNGHELEIIPAKITD